MNRLRYLILILVFISCESKESNEKLSLQFIYEDLGQSKADWPGLFLEKDSLVTIVSIVNDKHEVQKRFMYEGESDTLWTSILKRIKPSKNKSKDTIVDTFVAKPIKPDGSKFVLYFMSFDDSYVKVSRNNNIIFEGNVETFRTEVNIKKEGLRNIEVQVDGQILALDTPTQYNYIELIKKDTILACTYIYFSPI